MATLDYTALRAQTMGSGNDEEAVTVNTRALIDKVLARYSSEWTTLRELLQNAADAQATTVTIRFETLPSVEIAAPNTTNQSEILKHVLMNHKLRRLVVTNDGQPFGKNDWSRLKRIAEGNPDETKIGAFGVGFYSVFADCEDPFVSSGNEAMAFYWKENSLFTRTLQLPEGKGNKNTSFVLDYRNNTSAVPNLLSLCQFLGTSLTFVALQKIELQLDDWTIITLQKKVAPGVNVPISRDVETKTKEGIMRIQSLERENMQMDATFMNVVGWKPTKVSGKSTSVGDSTYGGSVEVSSLRSFFSRLSTVRNNAVKSPSEEVEAMQEIPLEDLTETTTTNVFLRVTTASIKTFVSSSFAEELLRATKKPPPKMTKLAILTSSYDELAAGSASKSIDVFSSVLPNKKPGGRVFIGFPTHQTTGASLHLSAPSVIPTVERESIDLNARWVRSWNIEMLRCAGIASRLAYVSEMAEFSAKIQRATEEAGNGKKVTKEIIQRFLPEALHILQTYTFEESTPSQQVSTIIEEAFWTTYRSGLIEVYSSRGVLLSTKVRLAAEDLSGFVEGIPVVPEELTKKSFVRKLIDFGLIQNIGTDDVRREIEAKALDKTQLTHFLNWIGKNAVKGNIDSPIIHQLLEVAVATLGEGESQGTVLALGTVTHYLNISKIPADVPIPPTTLPFEFSRSTSPQELQALGWEPLEIVPWLRFLIDSSGSRGLPVDQNITLSHKFAAQVLAIVSKQWDGSLSQSSKGTVTTLLRSKTVVPTKMGMKFPEDAYFPSVKLFDDLPTITSCPGVKEKFFSALGVRKTVDLEVIFTRLLNPAAPKDGEKTTKWNHVDLIKYLVSVREDIPTKDLARLKSTPLCPAAVGPDGQESGSGNQRLYKISELFEPKEILRKLGFPILQWPGATDNWRPGSAEGKFLSMLGLRPCPTPQELVDIMSGDDPDLRVLAMNYYITSHAINSYDQFSIAGSTKKFLPIEGDENRLVSPSECFTNMKATVLGFHILSRRLHPHANIFGVAADPNIGVCVDRLLLKPPQTHREAIALFSYFAGRLQEVSPALVQNKLANSKFIPITARSESEKIIKTVKHVTPTSCYLGTSEQFKNIFDFVDFSSEANTFLLKCGSRHEPSRNEVAQQMCREPARLLGIVQGPDKYLDLLTFLAVGLNDLKKDKLLFQKMKTSPFLLASKEIPSKSEHDGKSLSKASSSENHLDDDDDDDDEISVIRHFNLAAAKDVVIVDDVTSYGIFRESLLVCPQEDTLEKFYIALEVPLLSTLLRTENRVGEVLEKQDAAREVRKRILERSRIFLHDQTRDVIKHDVRWLEKNMEVKMVSSISMKRALPKLGLSAVEKRSAACDRGSSKGAIIYVVPKYDFYQLSWELVGLLMSRPQRHSAMMLESILSRPLLELRARGYNVDRILRVKAAEARIAEQQRQIQLQEEQQRIKDQEKQWENNQAAPAARESSHRQSGHVAMPGAFGSDSPENSPAANRPQRGLFSGIRKQLGLDTGEASKQLQNLLGNNQQGEQQKAIESPPPYDQTSAGAQAKRLGQPESVTAPHQLHQNLVNAIGASRAHDSTTLFSQPRTNAVKEQSTYCDSAQGHNIVFLASTSNGVRIFISKDLSIPATDFLANNVAALNTFSTLLFDVCDIYGIARKAIHIFCDETGPTIAFNQAGSVFCNYRYFEQLHFKQIGTLQGRVEATSWWWVVIAHELAHNLVSDHSAAHSYYTESFVQQYFPRMMARAAVLGQSMEQPQVQKQPEPSSSSLLD